jgi:hypothetical protein
MRKVIAIGGLPATGKTTILKTYIKDIDLQPMEPIKLVVTSYDHRNDCHILGTYSKPCMVCGMVDFHKMDCGQPVVKNTFQGTDTLSMAVQPNATEFLKTTKSNILFEGDRLFNAKFLEAAVDLVDAGEIDLKIVLVNADPTLVEQRHKDRGDTQTEKFLKGRETKYDNIRASFILMPYITEMNNNNETDLKSIVEWLRTELK